MSNYMEDKEIRITIGHVGVLYVDSTDFTFPLFLKREAMCWESHPLNMMPFRSGETEWDISPDLDTRVQYV